MATIQDFYSYVMPAVQGCPSSVVNNAIKHSINEFCEKTLMWREALDPISIVANTSEYATVVPTDTVLVAPVYVAVQSNQLSLTNIEDLDVMCSGWRNATANQPLWCYMDNAANITLVPCPITDIVDGLQIEAALKMDLTSTVCPDWLLQNWAETIAHGALMRLHAMPGHVWSDPSTVAYHKSKFRDGISRAKSRTMKSFTKQSKSVQPRQFWE